MKNRGNLLDLITGGKKESGTNEKKKTGRPQTRPQNLPPAEKGCAPGWRRLTVQVKIETADEIKNAAYWERMHEKDIVQAALEGYLKKKNTKPIPRKK